MPITYPVSLLERLLHLCATGAGCPYGEVWVPDPSPSASNPCGCIAVHYQPARGAAVPPGIADHIGQQPATAAARMGKHAVVTELWNSVVRHSQEVAYTRDKLHRDEYIRGIVPEMQSAAAGSVELPGDEFDGRTVAVFMLYTPDAEIRDNFTAMLRMVARTTSQLLQWHLHLNNDHVALPVPTKPVLFRAPGHVSCPSVKMAELAVELFCAALGADRAEAWFPFLTPEGEVQHRGMAVALSAQLHSQRVPDVGGSPDSAPPGDAAAHKSSAAHEEAYGSDIKDDKPLVASLLLGTHQNQHSSSCMQMWWNNLKSLKVDCAAACSFPVLVREDFIAEDGPYAGELMTCDKMAAFFALYWTKPMQYRPPVTAFLTTAGQIVGMAKYLVLEVPNHPLAAPAGVDTPTQIPVGPPQVVARPAPAMSKVLVGPASIQAAAEALQGSSAAGTVASTEAPAHGGHATPAAASAASQRSDGYAAPAPRQKPDSMSARFDQSLQAARDTTADAIQSIQDQGLSAASEARRDVYARFADSAAVDGAGAQGDIMADVRDSAVRRSDVDQRRGKWSPEEEAYTAELVAAFDAGVLPLAENITLRSLLSQQLHCVPMRITKKYNKCGQNLGKRMYHRSTAMGLAAWRMARDAALIKLAGLRRAFVEVVQHRQGLNLDEITAMGIGSEEYLRVRAPGEELTTLQRMLAGRAGAAGEGAGAAGGDLDGAGGEQKQARSSSPLPVFDPDSQGAAGAAHTHGTRANRKRSKSESSAASRPSPAMHSVPAGHVPALAGGRLPGVPGAVALGAQLAMESSPSHMLPEVPSAATVSAAAAAMAAGLLPGLMATGIAMPSTAAAAGASNSARLRPRSVSLDTGVQRMCSREMLRRLTGKRLPVLGSPMAQYPVEAPNVRQLSRRRSVDMDEPQHAAASPVTSTQSSMAPSGGGTGVSADSADMPGQRQTIAKSEQEARLQRILKAAGGASFATRRIDFIQQQDKAAARSQAALPAGFPAPPNTGDASRVNTGVSVVSESGAVGAAGEFSMSESGRLGASFLPLGLGSVGRLDAGQRFSGSNPALAGMGVPESVRAASSDSNGKPATLTRSLFGPVCTAWGSTTELPSLAGDASPAGGFALDTFPLETSPRPGSSPPEGFAPSPTPPDGARRASSPNTSGWAGSPVVGTKRTRDQANLSPPASDEASDVGAGRETSNTSAAAAAAAARARALSMNDAIDATDWRQRARGNMSPVAFFGDYKVDTA